MNRSGPYFNEIDPVACAVLRACHAGTIDERSIKDVLPDDVRGFERAHFFAGAGLWQIAADMAGWVGPLWTASCPCQPFSVAGKGAGRNDPRHLWPDFFRLARAARPPVIVGEQVAGAAGFDWFDGVAADLESEGYACRAVDIPACSIDAPHRRQGLYWVAVAQPHKLDGRGGTEWRDGEETDDAYASSAMADADSGGRDGRTQDSLGGEGRRDAAQRTDVGDAVRARLEIGSLQTVERGTLWHEGPATRQTDHRSFWMDAEWLNCADGKTRRAPRRSEPSLRDVADGFPSGFEGDDPSRLLVPSFKGRAAAWKITGNAIVPQVAAQVLSSLLETLNDSRL